MSVFESPAIYKRAQIVDVIHVFKKQCPTDSYGVDESKENSSVTDTSANPKMLGSSETLMRSPSATETESLALISFWVPGRRADKALSPPLTLTTMVNWLLPGI